MKTISFVVPCYGSEKTIESVVQEITDVMSGLEYDYEIILVNDCSPDHVWNNIRILCENDCHVKGIELARNFGQHAALMAGYNICSGDYVVTIDDDGQTPVDQITILLDKLSEGYDVVFGRYKDRKDNSFRKFGTVMNNFMLKSFLGKPKGVQLTSYFVAKKFIVKEMCKYKSAFPYMWGLVLRTTKNIGNAFIEHKERVSGESGYTLSKLMGLWMNGFTAFSVKPLRISAGIGVCLSGIGFLGLIYVVIYKFLNPSVQTGYSSLMGVMLIMGGLILLSLGMIGEYVGRIYLCINSTPQFVIKETLNCNEET